MRLEYRNPGTALSLERRLGARPSSGGTTLQSTQQASAFGWLRRFVLLTLLAGLLGGGAAAIAWYFQPPVYRAESRVQLIDLAQFHGFSPGRTSAEYGTPLSDEVLVVRSAPVLRIAAETGDLSGTDPFNGMRSEEIASVLNNDSSLVVEPAFADQATNVIRIQYDAPEPLTPKRVVEAIVEAYCRHTEQKFARKDGQVLSQVLAARDAALEKLQTLEREHDEFKMRTDLVFVDGRPQSVHRKTADRYQTQKEELLVTKAEIESQLSAAEASLEQGKNAQTVMLALRDETETASDVIDQNISNQLQRLQNELRDRASVRVREKELLPLELERKELLEKFGRSHPTVRAVDQQIAVVEAQVERLETEEEEKEALIAKVMSVRGAASKKEPSGTGTNEASELDPEKEARERVNLAIEAQRQRLESVQQQIDTVSKAYEIELEAAKKEIAAIRESERFERDIARQTELYEKILSRLDEVKLTAGSEALRVMPLDETVAGRRVVPPLVNWLGTGGLLGMLAGSILAILIPPRPRADEYHADQSPDQVSRHLNMPVLGHVPLLPAFEGANQTSLLVDKHAGAKLSTVHSPYGRVAEGFNAIRANLLIRDEASRSQVIQITSPAPGAGKSTVAANLAVSMARSGKKVLLVDVDFRRPSVQGLFGLPGTRGLGWLLETIAEETSKEEIANQLHEIVQGGPVANLSILTAGTSQKNPSEILSSDRVALFFETCREHFDFVLIDTPPMLAVTDASTLAPRVDGVLMVVGAGADNLSPAARAADMLAALKANVIGVIVTGVEEDDGKEYEIYRSGGRLRIDSGTVRDGAGHSKDTSDFLREDDGCPNEGGASP